MASEIPVLPLVGSSTVQPGVKPAAASARSIMYSAGRSLIEPVGLRSSSFAHRLTRPSALPGMAAESRGSRTSGVLPTAASGLSYRITSSRLPRRAGW